MDETIDTAVSVDDLEACEARDGARSEIEIEIDASPEEVWDALATEQGRERWLDEPAREIEVVDEREPEHLVWWWAEPGEPATRVEFRVLPAAVGTRVIVVETAPQFSAPLRFPASLFADSLMLVAA
jgi:uncharacterized protein YndB with AHSA1/START domain